MVMGRLQELLSELTNTALIFWPSLFWNTRRSRAFRPVTPSARRAGGPRPYVYTGFNAFYLLVQKSITYEFTDRQPKTSLYTFRCLEDQQKRRNLTYENE